MELSHGGRYWARTIAYRFFTLIIAWEMVAGSIWDLLHIEYVRVILEHLGYPLYLLYIKSWGCRRSMAAVDPPAA